MNKPAKTGMKVAAIATAILGVAVVLTNHVASPPSAISLYLPDAALTPGMVDPRLTDDVLLAPGFVTSKYRPGTDVTDKIKVQAFKLYGIPVTSENMKAYELDHAIPISEGGMTDIKNLWPEPWTVHVNGFELGARTKDRLEDYLMLQVRARKMAPSEARALLMPDWTKGYLKVFGAFPK